MVGNSSCSDRPRGLPSVCIRSSYKRSLSNKPGLCWACFLDDGHCTIVTQVHFGLIRWCGTFVPRLLWQHQQFQRVTELRQVLPLAWQLFTLVHAAGYVRYAQSSYWVVIIFVFCCCLLLCKTFDAVIADRSSADLNFSSFGSSRFSLEYISD